MVQYAASGRPRIEDEDGGCLEVNDFRIGGSIETVVVVVRENLPDNPCPILVAFEEIDDVVADLDVRLNVSILRKCGTGSLAPDAESVFQPLMWVSPERREVIAPVDKRSRLLLDIVVSAHSSDMSRLQPTLLFDLRFEPAELAECIYQLLVMASYRWTEVLEVMLVEVSEHVIPGRYLVGEEMNVVGADIFAVPESSDSAKCLQSLSGEC
ncbi:hypothetical protein Nmn1133_13950 [Halosegnis longus]|uniref:Uncharacterized protein n=1 Tax=Halosegnis longus TaxID=2216012 RepID=A0AAJ4R676_9EURY|nr:hypothetical protein Nmn1133_13950 [Salella cibi]